MRWVDGGVTAASGFLAAGVSAGIKRSRKPDLALVTAHRPVAAAGVFTANRVKAAPVVISHRRLRRGRAMAVLINSGCANCMTGARGYQDALTLGREVARALGVSEQEVLLASTGLIGRGLPVAKIRRAIPRLVSRLSRNHHHEAAQALLTTDRAPKEVAVDGIIRGSRFRLGGMAKGAGMIHPSMATMLGVLTTDVAIAPSVLRAMLRQAVGATFNRISVDGDMSTNDTIFALASGMSGVTIAPGTRSQRLFGEMLKAVCERLAWLIVRDGEGASKLMEVQVVGARTEREAQAAARQVANSPLVKTMLAGSDPNVGRIAAAVGASSAHFNPNRLEIRLGDGVVVSRGVALHVGSAALRSMLNHREVKVTINLRAGDAQARMLACDLTEAYVRLNAGYAT